MSPISDTHAVRTACRPCAAVQETGCSNANKLQYSFAAGRQHDAAVTACKACSARLLQAVRHSKSAKVVEEIKDQLKAKVPTTENPLAETIVAAGKEKLAKKPEDKQAALTSRWIKFWAKVFTPTAVGCVFCDWCQCSFKQA